jgi:tRNA-(ms[2]io[6]A)-hydroxylase
MAALPDLLDFLPCRTPEAWIARAQNEHDILLIDHANCEKKAASTALALMFRHVTFDQLQQKMSRLAREELVHFEQVSRLMRQRKVAYRPLSASRYASGLHQYTRKPATERLVDSLIIGAFIEARSCERFMALASHVDEVLGRFYTSLLKSEHRHFQDYLKLALLKASDAEIFERVAFFADIESGLIQSEDEHFRFHSGVPLSSCSG